jgi:hypothetical protein
MTISTIIMLVGIFFLVLSFFMKDRTKKVEKEVEELSLNIYQETNALKRRLKVVEEELLVEGSNPVPPVARMQQSPITPQHMQKPAQQTAMKPVHSILVNQVLQLGKQGLSISEIQKRSALTPEQITHILKNGGM